VFLYVYDSDLVRPQVLRKLSIQRYLVPQAVRRPWLGLLKFLLLTTGLPLSRFAPSDGQEWILERGMLRDTAVAPPPQKKDLCNGGVLVIYTKVDEKLNVL
jgi:hypothetical protein